MQRATTSILGLLKNVQVKQLCDIGVSAVRACSSDVSDVSKGKYRFGMMLRF